MEQKPASQFEVKVFPNPSSGNFSLTVKSYNIIEKIFMQVTDLYGRILEVQSINTNSTVKIGTQYAQGSYFVRFSQGTQHKQLKLIKH